MNAPGTLIAHTHVLEIVGDTIKVRASGPVVGELALVENVDGSVSTAEVVGLEQDIVSLQVYAGGKGQSTEARVRFLGHGKQSTFSNNVLGRIFNGAGEPVDGKPSLDGDPTIPTGGPTVNPMMRSMASNMIETEVPMIDIFNCLVESQKIPIFSVAGEPYNALLAHIGFQADADIVVTNEASPRSSNFVRTR
jgi:V/A-type H+-transporting ATPase subunit B